MGRLGSGLPVFSHLLVALVAEEESEEAPITAEVEVGGMGLVNVAGTNATDAGADDSTKQIALRA